MQSQYVLLRDIPSRNGDSVCIQGWVLYSRSSDKLIFIDVRDGTGIIQCVVFKGNVSSEVFELCKKLTLESSIIVEGQVNRDTRSKVGFEIALKKIEILHLNDDSYPISPKPHGVAFLLDHRHLWLRSSLQVAILRIRGTIINAARDFLNKRGFLPFDPPILTPTSCEGTSTLFETDYFGENAYLTQSGQLYLEAEALAHGRVYFCGPIFRVEKSKTRHHLTEFWMIEPEAAFFDLSMDIDLAQHFVAHIVKEVLSINGEELELLGRDRESLEKITYPFPDITYDEAVAILKKNKVAFRWGDDFGGDEETILSQTFDKPVVIHRYPAQCKAFYMKNDPDREDVVLCCDMLAPEGYGEIIGGGQREDEYDTLLEKIIQHGLDVEPLQWYLDLRKYGSVPHAGFGLGIERAVTWMCGLKHVRETIPFPRLIDRIKP